MEAWQSGRLHRLAKPEGTIGVPRVRISPLPPHIRWGRRLVAMALAWKAREG